MSLNVANEYHIDAKPRKTGNSNRWMKSPIWNSFKLVASKYRSVPIQNTAWVNINTQFSKRRTAPTLPKVSRFRVALEKLARFSSCLQEAPKREKLTNFFPKMKDLMGIYFLSHVSRMFVSHEEWTHLKNLRLLVFRNSFKLVASKYRNVPIQNELGSTSTHSFPSGELHQFSPKFPNFHATWIFPRVFFPRNLNFPISRCLWDIIRVFRLFPLGFLVRKINEDLLIETYVTHVAE